MKSGVIGLISLLLGVIILVIIITIVSSKLLSRNQETVTSANPEKIQTEVDDFQKQIQEKQNKSLDEPVN